MSGRMWRGASMRIAAAGLLAALLCAGPALALQSAPPPLSAYGALPSTELVQLSPSGDRLAFITVVGEQRRLAVIDLRTNTTLAAVGVGLVKVRDLE